MLHSAKMFSQGFMSLEKEKLTYHANRYVNGLVSGGTQHLVSGQHLWVSRLACRRKRIGFFFVY